ncbi:MAG: Ig-like domain-containing protein [Bacteroidota bacterium]|nr:Ig-like domain-containing protein [Bacteroidota bacterium]
MTQKFFLKSFKDAKQFFPKWHLKLFNISWLILLLFSFIGSSCKKVIEETGIIGVCPVVLTVTPANGANKVLLTTNLTATFNEVMDTATINTTTFVLMQGTTPIPGIVTYSGTTATFTPAGLLAVNTIYTATITTGAKDKAGNAMVANYVWTFNTGNTPSVVSTDPANGTSNVVLGKIITATFSTVMNPTTINTNTFIIKQGTNLIAGVVTYSGVTATFTPNTPLSANTVYSGTITTGAKDTSGNALMNNYNWSFSTSSVPMIILTDPLDSATNVGINKIITATFSTVMDPTTITSATYFVKQGINLIPGVVSYSGTKASFTPSTPLALNTVYTATVTTGAKDQTGKALANNYVWTFTTTAQPPPSPSILGTASTFGAFGGNAGITNQGLNTVINNGGIGTTAASTLVTGFHDGITNAVYTETPLNVGLVTGGIFTAPPAPGTATSFNIASNAFLDATSAYNSISPASMPGGIDPGAGELGGLTLQPGVYKSASGTFKITNGNLTLDAMGNPNAVWVFQTASGLTVGIAGPSGARSVNMINGGLPKNVYWYVGSAATINAAGGGIMVGTIISQAGVSFSTSGNAVQTVLNGRAISLSASVTMVNTTINVPN